MKKHFIAVWPKDGKIQSKFSDVNMDPWEFLSKIVSEEQPDDDEAAVKETPITKEDYERDKEVIENSMMPVMNEEMFMNVLKWMREATDWFERLDALGVSLIESPAFQSIGMMFDVIMSMAFEDEAIDIINWYCFDTDFHGGMYDYDEIGNSTELWNAVKDSRK